MSYQDDYVREALELSKLVYHKNDSQGNPYGSVPAGYSLVATKIGLDAQGNPTGYYGEAYSNGTTTIIVSRGTDQWTGPDLKTNCQIISQHMPNQLDSVEAFYDDLKKAGKLNNQEIIFAGHSLGGGLSEAMAAKTGLSAITYNAVGAANFLTPDKYSPSYSAAKITNFVVQTDATGNAFGHIGTTCYAQGPAVDLSGSLNPLDYFFQESHKLDNFDALNLENPLAPGSGLSMAKSLSAECIRAMAEVLSLSTRDFSTLGLEGHILEALLQGGYPIGDYVANNYMDVTISVGDLFSDASEAFWNGTVMGGADYEVSMESSILNGDGYDNAAMAGIASDFYRPGNYELSDLSFDDDIQRYELTGSIESSEDYVYLAGFHSVSIDARTTTNIDPLVLDLNGDGVQLISYEQSKVMFDVDADGYKETTAWATPQDGILVWDKNNNGQIDDITETISEYFTAGVKDGLEALATLDSNHDKVFDAQDAAYGQLRVWVDADSDGKTDGGELKTLSELGVESISLERQAADRERLNGSAVLSRSTMTMANGNVREVAAIDFTTNPMGYEFNTLENYLGVQALSQEGTSTFLVQDPNGVNIDIDAMHVTNVYGGVGNDTISGTIKNDWIAGGAGSDTLFGDAGNDVLIMDADDLPENIDGGQGRDIVFVNDTRGVYLNLAKSKVEVAVGGAGNDVFIGGGNTNVFMDGGKGDDVLLGGTADDALSGGDGDDLINGGAGDDILRGHRGADVLVGDDGNDYMDGGAGDDILRGGLGGDLLVGSEGNDTLDGGEGNDVVSYHGNYENYKVEKTTDGFTVTKLQTGEKDALKNIENVRFNNFNIMLKPGHNPLGEDWWKNHSTDEYLDVKNKNNAPLPVSDSVVVGPGQVIQINPSQLLANDWDVENDSLSIVDKYMVVGNVQRDVTVDNAVGGTVTLENGVITFTRDPKFLGVPTFDYAVQDRFGAVSSVLNKRTGESEPMRATVKLLDADDPADPLYSDQWYLSEIKVKGAWPDYTGQGVQVGVFEGDQGEGFNYLHPDLDNNVSVEYKKDMEFSQVTQFDRHETIVAGIIAAERNGLGSVGVAYDAQLSGYSWDNLEAWQQVDVANNSWGFESPFVDNFTSSWMTQTEQAFLNAAGFGREGLGTAVISSAGNSRQAGDNVNHHSLKNSPYEITVGAINQEGNLGKLISAEEPFSTPGSAILVSAPGSNIESTSNLLENDNGSTFGDSFESTQGTSFAAPIVSGVAALMLEANPNLGYRDIQKILAMTATSFTDTNTVWKTNGSTNVNGKGMHYSEDYGFGLVDAHAAVRLAEVWNETNNLNNEEVLGFSNSTDLPILDRATASSIINVNQDLQVEYVEVSVDIDHARLGDLILKLVSPTGTESILMNRPGKALGSPEQDFGVWNGMENFKFTFSTTHDYTENAKGAWQLQVTDAATGEQGILLNWDLKIHGSADMGKDMYVFTDEYTSSSTLADTDNSLDDTIYATSLMTDSNINLNANTNSTINGRSLYIASGSKIENAYGGDGNDTLIGNEWNNILDGGRGNNQLTGNGGSDIFKIKSHAGQADVITDFNTSAAGEKIDLSDFKFADLSSLQLAQVGNDAVIDLGDNQKLTLQNVQASALLPDHFLGLMNQAVTLQGGSGNDNLYGDDRDNVIDGGAGSDYLSGGGGNNVLTGGEGADTFFVGINPGKTDEIIDFDLATEKISLQGFTSIKDISQLNVSYNAGNAIIQLENNQTVTLHNITGSLSAGNFIFAGQQPLAVNNEVLSAGIYGNDGDNNLTGTVGGDYVEGGGGADRIDGWEGDDILVGGAGDDQIEGGDGADEIYVDFRPAWLAGETADPSDGALQPEPGSRNSASGGAGNDTIYGGKGHDTLLGDVGKDTLYGEEGDDTLFGGDTAVVLTKEQVADYLQASEKGWSVFQYQDDTLVGGTGNDVLVGGSGADVLYGDSTDLNDTQGGNDLLLGGAGVDFLYGGAGNDTLDGGEDDNFLFGGIGNDSLYHWGNTTQMAGGEGDDTFIIGRAPNSKVIISDFEVNNSAEKIDVSAFSDLGLDFYQVDQTTMAVYLYDYAADEAYPVPQFLLIHGNGIQDLSPDNFIFNGVLHDESGPLQLTGTEGADTIYGRNFGDTITGLSGDDYLDGNLGDDTLHGGDGNDTLLGDAGNDVLYGEAGNDGISGNDGNDTTDGGAGNDLLDGGEGKDTLLGGAGDDYLSGGYDNDSLDGGDGQDVLFGGQGNDLLVGGAGDDVLSGGMDVLQELGPDIQGTEKSDILSGTGKSESIYGGEGSDKISGNAGDDFLYGEAGYDRLEGGQGNDTLDGGDDADIYVFNRRDGQDTIVGLTEGDKLSFGAKISQQDLELVRDKNNLIINFKESEDRITVNNYYDYSRNGLSMIAEFSGGEVMALPMPAWNDISVANIYSGSDQPAIIVGTAGDDAIDVEGNSDISGGPGNDLVLAMKHNYYDEIVFRFNPGDGQDTIRGYFSGYSYKLDIKEFDFGAGIDAEDLEFIRSGVENLVIKIKDSSDQITIDRFFAADRDGEIPVLKFSNGATLALNKNLANVVDESFPGEEDTLRGGLGNDILDGGSGDDVLEGGQGNDTLSGGLGNDVYLFGLGDGQDDIVDYNWLEDDYPAPVMHSFGTDKIKFGQGISSQDIEFGREQEALILKIKNTQDQIKVEKFFSTESAHWEQPLKYLEFADGTQVDLTRGQNLSGTTWSDADFHQWYDQLSGTTGDDILAGGPGNDILSGGLGNDTYVFNRGDGEDTIIDVNNTRITGAGYIVHRYGKDKIRFGEGITKNDIAFSKDFLDLVVGIKGTNSRIILENYFSSDSYSDGHPIQTLEFSDGTSMGLSVSESNLPALVRTENGTSGNDTLHGFNDTLAGGAGNDTYLFNRGDGSVVVVGVNYYSGDGPNGRDKIVFGTGITRDDLDFVSFDGSLFLKLKNSSDQIILSDFFGTSETCPPTVKTLEFADTSTINLENGACFQGTNPIFLYGTGENDYLYGSAGADQLNGGTGRDWLNGALGNDTLLGGDGDDKLYGNDGDDMLDGGAGSDTLAGGLGNDEMHGRDGNDMLSGEAGNDIMSGETGNDELQGGEGDDRLYGGAGNDWLMGGAGADDLRGEDDDDVLSGQDGNDVMYGGAGSDTLNGDAGNDILCGEAGNDELQGGEGKDILYGGTGNDQLSGGAGADILCGEDDDDVLSGQDGDDALYGGAGTDTLNGDVGNDILCGEAGNDKLQGGNGDDRLYGGTGNDQLSGDAGADDLRGEDGDDVLSGQDGNDAMYGGAGNDNLNGGTGNDFVHGETGDDYLFGQDGNDFLLGDEGNDSCYGGTGNDNMLGGAGADNLRGEDGDDVLCGQEGDDVIQGGSGKDIMLGGFGADTFVFSAAGDSMQEAMDLINDFEQGTDHLDVSALGFEAGDFGTAMGYIILNGKTLIEDIPSGFTVQLNGEHQLTSSDFIFAQ